MLLGATRLFIPSAQLIQIMDKNYTITPKNTNHRTKIRISYCIDVSPNGSSCAAKQCI